MKLPKIKLATCIYFCSSILLISLASWFFFLLGKSTLGSKMRGTIEVNGKKDEQTEVFKTNMNAPIVCLSEGCYLLSPFELLRGDSLWRVGRNLVSFRDIYGEPGSIFVGTEKWETRYDPKLTLLDDRSITFTTPRGDKVRLKMESNPSINWD